MLNGAVGVVGFRAGADGHVVDPLLCDPLVARLPARDPSNWRIGHVLRRLPEGYWESLRDDANRIHHPGLRRYYDALRALTRAPVFSSDRLAHLQDMALGRLDDDLRAFLDEDYYDAPRIAVDLDDLATPLPSGAFWFDEPGVCVVYEGGLEVPLAGASAARQLQLQVWDCAASASASCWATRSSETRSRRPRRRRPRHRPAGRRPATKSS